MSFNGEEASGTVPEFGSIFMCNKNTKKECFERKLFGLPPNLSDYVEKVKQGMILFLFEFEEKKLYGVFEAVSDGELNIVPNAYQSSGGKFPAQVEFRVIWKCNPLFEREFRPVLQENYFTSNKFNFGLSKNQVYNLLCLFDSKRVKIENLDWEKKVKTENVSSNEEKSSFEKLVDNVLKEILPCVTETKLVSELEDFIPLCDSPDKSMDLEDYIPLPCSPEKTEIKEINEIEEIKHYPKLKRMYSDDPVNKPSVFTRLNLNMNMNAQYDVKEVKKDLDMDSSVKLIMEELIVREKKWVQESGKWKRNVIKYKKRDYTERYTHTHTPRSGTRTRSSVFSRLSEVSRYENEEAKIVENVEEMTRQKKMKIGDEENSSVVNLENEFEVMGK